MPGGADTRRRAMLGGMDEEIEAVRTLFWESLEEDGVAAGIVWRTDRETL